jgi:hypothetical protein
MVGVSGASAQAQRSQPNPQGGLISTQEEISADLKQVPCRDRDRLEAARLLFLKMGADPAEVSIEKRGSTQNLVIPLRGTTGQTIVVGAHYDMPDLGCGAVDNWTGVVAMAHIYHSMRQLANKKTILFTAFGKKEDGLSGSRGMAKSIPKSALRGYCAMVNIDGLGMGNPFTTELWASPKLVRLAETVAAKLNIPFYKADFSGISGDSLAFRQRGIPVVTLSGLSDKWESVIHTLKDQADQINPTSVHFGYRLGLSVLANIDAEPCDSFR